MSVIVLLFRIPFSIRASNQLIQFAMQVTILNLAIFDRVATVQVATHRFTSIRLVVQKKQTLTPQQQFLSSNIICAISQNNTYSNAFIIPAFFMYSFIASFCHNFPID